MTEYLDSAVDQAESLYERLQDTQELGDDLKVTEDEIEKRVSEIISAVKMHNDQLAKDELGWGDS